MNTIYSWLCCSDVSFGRKHNMHRLERIEQVTETLQLQTEQASEIVKSPMMQRAMLLDSSLWYLVIFGISAVWSLNTFSLREENDTKVIHSCLRKSVSTRLPLSISASGPQARKELIDPMLRVGSLPVTPCSSGATCAGCDLETGGSHPVFHQSLNCTLNSALEVSGSRPDQCFD